MFTSRRITTMGGDKFRDEYSMFFDGSDEHIDIDTGLNSSLEGDFTISCWVKATESRNQTVFSAQDNSSDGVALTIGSGENVKLVLNDDTSVSTGAPLNLNKWCHLVGQYNDSTNEANLYVDGVLTGASPHSVDKAISGVSADATIGELSYGGNNFKGNISEVAIYNKALSASEIKTLYNSREPYNHKEGVASGNLQAWYRMGDGTYDQKSTDDLDGGIVCDMNNVSLGSDVFGGKGDFSDASYWTLDDATIEDGLLKFADNGDNYAECKKLTILDVDKMYRIDVTVDRNDGAKVIINEGDPYIRVSDPIGATGTFTAYWRASSTAFRLYRTDTTGDEYDQVVHISNLVVREVTGGHHGQIKNMNPNSFKGDTP